MRKSSKTAFPTPSELRERQTRALEKRTREWRENLMEQMNNWKGGTKFTLRGEHNDRIPFENLVKELPDWVCRIETIQGKQGSEGIQLVVEFPLLED
jgi:hypothetical protein